MQPQWATLPSVLVQEDEVKVKAEVPVGGEVPVGCEDIVVMSVVVKVHADLLQHSKYIATAALANTCHKPLLR